MLRALNEIRVDHTVVGYRHIRDQIRSLIVAGELSPGVKLPSTHDLASRWEVDAGTVHTALAGLVKEGWLVRQMRKGTFVRDRRHEERLTAVGVYCAQCIVAPDFSLFLQTLHRELLAELERQHIQAIPCYDPRTGWSQRRTWSDLDEMARRRRIQAIVSLSSGWGRYRWLSKLAVPVVHFTSAKLPSRIETDLEQFMKLAVGRLAEQGCRSVGLIAPVNPHQPETDEQRNVGAEMIELFLDQAGQFGLQVKNQWVRVSHGEARSRVWDERFGYREFQALWEQPSRPEGLLVAEDTTARGVITAILEARVQLPEELKVVFHRNEEVDLLCPLPASFVVVSVREAARAAVGMLQELYRGKSVTPVRLPCRLVKDNLESWAKAVANKRRESTS